MNRKGRPKMNTSLKKESLLSSAKELFCQYGLNKVSVDEICEKAKTSKMTFYRHFEDKSDLVVTLLNLHYRNSETEFQQLLAQKVPFSKKFQQLLELNDKSRKELGLLFTEESIQTTDPK